MGRLVKLIKLEPIIEVDFLNALQLLAIILELLVFLLAVVECIFKFI